MKINYTADRPGSYLVSVNGVQIGTIVKVFRFNYSYWKPLGVDSIYPTRAGAAVALALALWRAEVGAHEESEQVRP